METTTPTPISMVSQISVIEWTVDTRERSAVLAHRSGMKLLPVMREPSMPARKADEHASVHDWLPVNEPPIGKVSSHSTEQFWKLI